MIDLELEDQGEPKYSEEKGWKSVFSSPFLVPHKSHPLFKSFYVPFYSEKYNKFAPYHLFRNLRKIPETP